jgi:hypothetical protein
VNFDRYFGLRYIEGFTMLRSVAVGGQQQRHCRVLYEYCGSAEGGHIARSTVPMSPRIPFMFARPGLVFGFFQKCIFALWTGNRNLVYFCLDKFFHRLNGNPLSGFAVSFFLGKIF